MTYTVVMRNGQAEAETMDDALLEAARLREQAIGTGTSEVMAGDVVVLRTDNGRPKMDKPATLYLRDRLADSQA